MTPKVLGSVLMVGGLVAVLTGALAYVGALSWIGRLPGDIRFESGGTRVYIPLATMLVVSVALSVVMAVVRRFL